MLGYCTNVFPGDSFSAVIQNLEQYVKPLNKALPFDVGIGIWLSSSALREADEFELKDAIERCDTKLVSCNGFPAGNFHANEVKHNVYLPNWSMGERLEYTVSLAELCAKVTQLKSFSISTVPLGWNDHEFENADATRLLLECIDALERIEDENGVCVHLDLEAEPGCRLQTSEDISHFVNSTFGDDARVRRYLRVCHDTCHAAVMQESIEDCLANYANAGLLIGKVQVSSAIQCSIDETNQERQLQELSQFIEPKYLHQTTVTTDSQTLFFGNLDEAIQEAKCGDWRVHFHIPIHNSNISTLNTTQQELIQSIEALKDVDVDTWEVETYTWNELPRMMEQDDLVESMAKELRWAHKNIYS